MANSVQILDKIERNMGQRGVASTRVSAEELTVDGVTVTYVAKAAFPAGNPMLGVSDAASPFLGVGVAGPGTIQMEDSGSTLATVIDTADRMTLFAECAGFANDLIVKGSDGQADIAGQSDVIGLGE